MDCWTGFWTQRTGAGGQDVLSKSWYCRHSFSGCWATFPRHLYRFNAPAAVGGLAETLTARETEILGLVAAGMRNQEIADQLVISLSTVKRHIANTYGKLGVTHRTEAVARLTS
jgi:ATP/maltotriose-dependent transcriptional regulator MalT